LIKEKDIERDKRKKLGEDWEKIRERQKKS
jgi:hypothetical protein